VSTKQLTVAEYKQLTVAEYTYSAGSEFHASMTLLLNSNRVSGSVKQITA